MSEPVPTTESPMQLVVYTSVYTGKPDAIGAVLDDIRVVAKARNEARGITGVLFYENGRFLQLIEGERSMVRLLIEEINRDPRHTDITVLIDERLPTQQFSDWSMDTFDISDPNVFSREQLIRFRDMYNRNIKMDSAVFLDLLKGVLSDPSVQELMNR